MRRVLHRPAAAFLPPLASLWSYSRSAVPTACCHAAMPPTPPPNTFASSPLNRLNHLRDAPAPLQSSDPPPLAITFNPSLDIYTCPSSLLLTPYTPTPTSLLLGRLPSGALLYATRSETPPTPTPTPTPTPRPLPLRALAHTLPAADAALAAHARSLLEFHARHAFCGRCGQPTRVASHGAKRRCTAENCSGEWFPRTDPVVIAVVVDVERDRCLLGRQARWPVGRFSALAGFMEHGESCEEAVAREVREEAGVVVDVGRCRYHSTQPWPFPYNLMVGMVAAGSGAVDIAAGDGELEDARWFTREEMAEMVHRCDDKDGGELRVPPPMAIAHHLCKAFADRHPITIFEAAPAEVTAAASKM